MLFHCNTTYIHKVEEDIVNKKHASTFRPGFISEKNRIH